MRGKDPFDPQNFPTEEELEAEVQAKRFAEDQTAEQIFANIECGIGRALASGKDKARRVEVDITGLNFDAVKQTIDMMPGGCELIRDGERVYIEGFDPDFVVWGATRQGYIKGVVK